MRKSEEILFSPILTMTTSENVQFILFRILCTSRPLEDRAARDGFLPLQDWGEALNICISMAGC